MYFFKRDVPNIDLHGLTSEIAKVLVEDFIKENVRLGNKEIVIIHGIGTGILKNETHKILYKYKNICEYATSNFNRGITLVRFF